MDNVLLYMPCFNEKGQVFGIEVVGHGDLEERLLSAGFNRRDIVGNRIGVEVVVFGKNDTFVCQLKDCDESLFAFYCEDPWVKFECVERLMNIAKNITLSRTKED